MSTRTQEKGAVTSQETDPDLPVSARNLQWRPRLAVACYRVRGTECGTGPFEGAPIIFITSTIVWSQVKQQGGNTASSINRKFV